MIRIINCPHCNNQIFIEKINCKIFIHGYKKSTMKQVGPHGKLKYINKLKSKNNLLGCGGKFKYNGKDITLISLEDFDKY
jgi:hypothetical protein